MKTDAYLSFTITIVLIINWFGRQPKLNYLYSLKKSVNYCLNSKNTEGFNL
jgi:hypothetical protein